MVDQTYRIRFKRADGSVARSHFPMTREEAEEEILSYTREFPCLGCQLEPCEPIKGKEL